MSINVRWLNWRSVLVVVFDKKIPLILKGKYIKGGEVNSTIWSSILPAKKVHVQKLKVA